MNACELSPDDMALALSLLADKKKKDNKKQAFKESIHCKISKIYNDLNIPHGHGIQMVLFVSKYTLIHSDSIFLYLGSDPDDTYGNRFSDESTRIDGYMGDTLVEQENKSQRSKAHISTQGMIYGKPAKFHRFYMNQIMKCPFCGKSEVTDCGELFYDLDFHLKYKDDIIPPQASDLYDTPMKLRRCREHKDMSRKDYLSCKGMAPYLQDRHKERLELYRRIYPQKSLRDKKYYAEKRIRKVTKTRPLTKSEQMFFTMLLGASKLAQISK